MSFSKIFIGNLPFTLAEDDLEKIFARYCEVKSVHLVKDSISGSSRGFGFVEVSDSEKVIEKLNNSEFQGRILIVKNAVDRGNW